MSTQAKPDFEPALISETAVCDYLSEHPDFFEKHHDLLRSLRLPHVTGGTVSLVERQVTALRQRDVKLERRLKELLEVARANDSLAGKIHALSLTLLSCASLDETIRAIESALRTEFDAEQSVLVLFREPQAAEDTDSGRFLRFSDRDDEAWLAFETLLKRSSPRCGQIRDAQRDELFGEGTDEIGSCALVPLGTECELGFLAIGSADSDRFHPAMSIDFLTRLGELVAAALSRY
ncbi:MAG: DUF484 family protein [Woeseiaceae bacterium]|nr:DUF484 family protein [Woeseiaceae bacterium]